MSWDIPALPSPVTRRQRDKVQIVPIGVLPQRHLMSVVTHVVIATNRAGTRLLGGLLAEFARRLNKWPDDTRSQNGAERSNSCSVRPRGELMEPSMKGTLIVMT